MTTNLLSGQFRRAIAKQCVVFCTVLMALISAGCQGEPKTPMSVFEDPRYAGWKFVTDQNVRIFYPPGHPSESEFPKVLRSYLRDMNEISKMIGMNTPTDTLTVVYYTGYGQGRDLTGQEYPFVKDRIIYFWLPSYIGPTLVEWLLPYWEAKEPKHEFLRQGIMALFDYSGQDYHKVTVTMLKDNKFEPLAKLAVDTNINVNLERTFSAEAASFVAYIIAYHGGARLKTMYQSDEEFAPMIERLFYLPVDSLEKEWLNFAKGTVALQEGDTTAVFDTTGKK